MPWPRRRNKFNARACVADGIRFDSHRERLRYATLRALEGSGRLEQLQVHPRYRLEVNGVLVGHYRPDFVYVDRTTGRQVVEDVKGVRTRDYVLRKKLLKALYNLEVVET